MEQLLWECIYKDKGDNQIYAERFEATNAVGALYQLSQYLKDKCDFIPLGVKPIMSSTTIRSQKYREWLNESRQFWSDINATIRHYENDLIGIIE
jgi:hypothetical protein